MGLCWLESIVPSLLKVPLPEGWTTQGRVGKANRQRGVPESNVYLEVCYRLNYQGIDPDQFITQAIPYNPQRYDVGPSCVICEGGTLLVRVDLPVVIEVPLPDVLLTTQGRVWLKLTVSRGRSCWRVIFPSLLKSTGTGSLLQAQLQDHGQGCCVLSPRADYQGIDPDQFIQEGRLRPSRHK